MVSLLPHSWESCRLSPSQEQPCVCGLVPAHTEQLHAPETCCSLGKPLLLCTQTWIHLGSSWAGFASDCSANTHEKGVQRQVAAPAEPISFLGRLLEVLWEDAVGWVNYVGKSSSQVTITASAPLLQCDLCGSASWQECAVAILGIWQGKAGSAAIARWYFCSWSLSLLRAAFSEPCGYSPCFSLSKAHTVKSFQSFTNLILLTAVEQSIVNGLEANNSVSLNSILT